MANDLCTSLRLIDKDLSGKVLQIVEEHGTSASFVLGSFVWNASRSNTSILLLALNNSLAHYQNVTKKLGFNLKSAIECKKAVVFEPISEYCETFWKLGDAKDIELKDYLDEKTSTLLESVKNSLDSMSGKKCLVIDDLSVLMSMGAGLAKVVSVLQFCRSLLELDQELYLVVGSHVSDNCEEHRLLADYISHVADLRVTVAPLRTGFSTNVTGTMEVVDDLERTVRDVSEKKVFHFKLTDRQIKIFAPGTVGVFG